MNLQHRLHRASNVIPGGLVQVMNQYAMRSALHGHDGRLSRWFVVDSTVVVPATTRRVEKTRKRLGLNRRARHDYPKIPTSSLNLLQQTQKHIRRQRSLVRLIHHDDRVLCQQRILRQFSEQRSVGAKLNLRLLRAHVFEPNRVSHDVSQRAPNLLRHALRHALRRDASRLRHGDASSARAPTGVSQKLWNLRRLPASRVPDDDCGGVFFDAVEKLIRVRGDWKRAALRRERRAGISIEIDYFSLATAFGVDVHVRREKRRDARFERRIRRRGTGTPESRHPVRSAVRRESKTEDRNLSRAREREREREEGVFETNRNVSILPFVFYLLLKGYSTVTDFARLRG